MLRTKIQDVSASDPLMSTVSHCELIESNRNIFSYNFEWFSDDYYYYFLNVSVGKHEHFHLNLFSFV